MFMDVNHWTLFLGKGDMDSGSNKGKQPSIMEVSPTPKGKTWYEGVFSTLNFEWMSILFFLLLCSSC
jgi:hypothetical protein